MRPVRFGVLRALVPAIIVVVLWTLGTRLTGGTLRTEIVPMIAVALAMFALSMISSRA